ncbi:MAG: succinylglutamate desuccinylase/aspartoacylase family protein [Acidobacteria bacterium]|nr:succinylglutamate desuccinylase/aspartoacylase family protein [Acidobacteriota bacterium]MBI3422619.1 succinylglutamate desuccinylase/aspartoacylase family protein [Acidobacteriota bacterium]
MFRELAATAIQPGAFPRRLGSYGGTTYGPLVVCVGGMHGNEPAGVRALERVLQHLRQTRPPFNGKLVALAGNVGALARGQRFVQRDLNRMWSPARIRQLKTGNLLEIETAETAEQRELLTAIETEVAGKFSQAVFLDLHTTSAAGAPFGLISDTLVNRRYAQRLRTPIILGLEESLEGTLLNYINELGHAALGFEAGQHASALALKNHEAALWTTLVTAGCLPPEHVPNWHGLQRTLREASRSLPPVLEVRYRHAIRPADQFVMEPGFVNFQPVERGELLAHDRNGAVRAAETGYLFMPLYQAQGEDGFFLIRAIRPFWLELAAWLRRLRLDRLLAWLPGVRRLPEDKNSLLIDPQIARWYVLEICHLLGFRKQARQGNKLLVTRRRQSEAD